LAVEIGLPESVILLQLEYLISISTTLPKDGNLWTYQSLADLQGYFPWWHESTIDRAVNNLRVSGLLLFGNYNRNKQDRTRWYALNWPGVAMLKSVRVDESILQNAKWLRQKPTSKRQDPLPTLQNETTILQIETPILQDETAILQNETTLPEISPETSTKTPPENSVSHPNPKPRIFDPSEVWNFVLGQLQAKMSRANFETWVQAIRVREVAGRTFVVEIGNQYAREWITNRLQKRIENILSGSIGQEMQLVILLPGEARMVEACAKAEM
jgi:hypothetical protein